MLDKIQQRLLDLKAAQDADTPMNCPRCGADTMKQPLHTNALSRIADVYICDSCGTAEGLLAMMRHSYPLHRWHVFQPQKPESDFKDARTRMCWQRYCRPRLIPWNTPSSSAGTIPTMRLGIATTHLKAVPV